MRSDYRVRLGLKGTGLVASLDLRVPKGVKRDWVRVDDHQWTFLK